MTTTITSTTGSQPITFDRISPGKVMITIWDGSTQVYWIEDLRRACHDESY